MARSFTPQRIGYLHAQLEQPDSISLVISGTIGFSLLTPHLFFENGPFSSELSDELGESGILDLRMPKVSGELLVWGHAHAQKPVRELMAHVRCGSIRKSFVVTGDRHWEAGPWGWRPSMPAYFEKIAISWDRAFGGPGHASNPLGRGAGKEVRTSDGELCPLPNIEYAHDRLLHPGQQPKPCGLRLIDPSWNPKEIKGTFGPKWLAYDWPSMPADFDWGYYNRAPSEQVLSEGYWRGDELISLQGMHPDLEQLESHLPGVRMRCFSVRPETNVIVEHPMVLDTVCLFPSISKGQLIFRAVIADVGVNNCQLNAVMLCAEWLTRPKSITHYQHVYNLRSDNDTGADYLLDDQQLMPELTDYQFQDKAQADTQAFDDVVQKAKDRAQDRRLRAASAIGAAAISGMSVPSSQAAPLFPVTTPSDIAFGHIKLNQATEAAAASHADAAAEIETWSVEANALLSDSETPSTQALQPEEIASAAPTDNDAPTSEGAALAEAADITAPDTDQLVASFDALAVALETQSTRPVGEIFSGWVDGLFPNAGDLGLGSDLMQAQDLSSEARAELASGMRNAAQAIQSSSAMFGTDASDEEVIEAALNKLPESMRPGMRKTINELNTQAGEASTSSNPFELPDQFSKLAQIATPGGALQAASQWLGSAEPAALDAMKSLADSLNAQTQGTGLSKLMADPLAAGLSPDVLTGKNALGLMSWMTGKDDASNPLIKAIEDISASAGGDSNVLSSLRLNGTFASNPTMQKLLGDLQSSLAESGEEMSSIDEKASTQASWVEALKSDSLSLNDLMALLNEPEPQATPEPETPPPADLESSAQAAPEERLAMADEPGSDSAFATTSQPHDPQAAQAEAAATAAAAAAATMAAANSADARRVGVSERFLAKMKALRSKGEDAVRDARLKARRMVMRPPKRTALTLAALADTVRQGLANGVSFAGEDLSGIKLIGEDLSGINFEGALLEGADLSGANLSNALCAGAVFTSAKLSGAKFNKADMRSCNLSNANAQNSIWEGANLSDAVFTDADFSNASIQNAQLDRCDAKQTRFECADLSESTCEDGDFLEANFRRAKLDRCRWHKSLLLDVNLEGMRAVNAQFRECNFVGASGTEANFANACLEACSFIGATLPQFSAPGAAAEGSSWAKSDLGHSNFERAVLKGAIFMNANLEHANLRAANLRNAILSGANLIGANLSDAQLLGGSLYGANATAATLAGANLEDVEFSGAMLDRCDLTASNIQAGLLAKPTHA